MKKQVSEYPAGRESTDLTEDQAAILAQVGQKADEATVNKLAGSFESHRDETKAQFSKRWGEVNRLRGDVGELRGELTALRTEVKSLSERMSRLEHRQDKVEQLLVQHREENLKAVAEFREEILKIMSEHREENLKIMAGHREQISKEIKKEIRHLMYVVVPTVVVILGIAITVLEYLRAATS